MADKVTFRPITEQDHDFLYRVYASTRQEELAAVDWTKAQKETFLTQQFQAQHRYYQDHFPDARFDILLVDDSPAGRLYVDARVDEIRLIDIALLPGFRNRGIGARLLRDLLSQAEGCGKPVRIHVEKLNPALRLYKRLGFVETDDAGVYWLMQWSPQENSYG